LYEMVVVGVGRHSGLKKKRWQSFGQTSEKKKKKERGCTLLTKMGRLLGKWPGIALVEKCGKIMLTTKKVQKNLGWET